MNMNMSSCALETGVILDGFCATEIPIEIGKPRSVRASGFISDMLVLERNSQSVVWLFDSDGDGMPDTKRTIASAPSLNHGLAIHEGYVYASSDSTVYRWPLLVDLEDFDFNTTDVVDLNSAEIIVNNINRDGQGGAPQGHTTRTLEFDDDGTLYIAVGSDGNVDPDSHRSRIRRFSINDENITFPVDFQEMEVFADGLRNTVGMGFDKYGVLWGVENGADNLQREDLGGDITENNAEELNRFREEDAGMHFGYPYCWTEFNLPEPHGNGTGSVWAWPSFLDNGFVSDEECRNDYIAPMVSMQAHSAPLGVTFFKRKTELQLECENTLQFPQWMDGFAFIAHHGSWNRDVPTGYKVVYVAMDEEGNPSGIPVDVLAHEPPSAKWEDGFRPVDVDFDDCGRLIVTSDGTGSSGSKVVRIEWMGRSSEEPSVTPTAVATSMLPTALPSIQPSAEKSSVEPSSNPQQPEPSNSPSGAQSKNPTPVPSEAFCLISTGNRLFSIGVLAALLYAVAEC